MTKIIKNGEGMNNNILISVCVLQNFWDKHKKDTLDILMPFLKVCIAKTTKTGEMIDVNIITQTFRNEFGYDDIPINVITVMLNRLSPDVIKRENGKYKLKKNLDQEVINFEKKRLQNKERQEKVVKALKAHLEENLPAETFTFNDIEDYLYSFFVAHGLCIAKNAEGLIGLKRKDGKVEYEIARFIMDEYHKDSVLFAYVNDLVKGFFVSTAMSIQQASTSVNAKMKGLSCYIDTRIIINALGLHLPTETKTSVIEFLDMLKSSGVKLFCFRHNYDEIQKVLTAYKMSVSNTRKKNPWNTLEFFDEQGYSSADVESYIARLSYRIKELGIEIIDTPSFDTEKYEKAAHIDYVGLEELLKKEMHYNPNSMNAAVKADTDSASAIMLLRNGHRTKELEKARYIFVSSNIRYCNIVSRFLGTVETGDVPVAYSETDLSSLMWLRNYSTHKDYPKSKLIENALAVLEVPSPQFITSLFETIDRLQAQGDISADEATILRQDYYTKKEILKIAKGDADAITDDTLKNARDRLRKQYVGEENKQAQLNYNKYLEQKAENSNSVNNAIKAIQDAGDTAYVKQKRWLSILANILMSAIFVIVGFCMIYGISTTSLWAFIVAGVICIINLIGVYDLLKDKKKSVSKWIEKYAQKKSDEVMDAKREEYETVLGKFDQRDW